MKTEVYSWRVSTEVKTSLEREAHRRKVSVSALLDLAARDWLNKNRPDNEGTEEQVRLRNAASKFFGTLASGSPRRSENARRDLRQRLRRRHDG